MTLKEFLEAMERNGCNALKRYGDEIVIGFRE